MKFPDPIRVKVDVNFNFTGISKEKQVEEQEVEPVDLSKLTLNNFRSSIHELILEELKEIYGTDDWKQIFIDRVKSVHNNNILLQVLTKFEQGDSMTENLLLLFLKEIYIQKKQLNLIFTKDGALNLK